MKEHIEDIKCALDSENITIIGLERKNIAKYINYLEQENERLHNIIKEVREYIINHQCCYGKLNLMTKKELEELLEILDKEGKE